MERADRQDAQRRTVHSAGPWRDDLAAGSARGIELGERRGQSVERPDVPEYAGLADDLQIESGRSARQAEQEDGRQGALRGEVPGMSRREWRARGVGSTGAGGGRQPD